MTLSLTLDSTARSACVRIAGDLDYGHTDELLDAVSGVLADDADVAAVHLDFTDLTFCDSVGLSALLQVRRLTSNAGARLQLDNRPAHLDRILELTGVLDYLTADPQASPDSEETEIG
ncbi:anti-anti-sigma factor [Mycolicibacterium rutilum]|uniref:Anti-sigma factor antagonist n=1 Tax=Mycolicibacterium rutilum TaxID=370526 RepID=A0A1H6IYD7_MYCRU|nr:STAS domain-containing protein [Mycolicibacterium rutilum]SEH51490.1 anti-anti-sigma factor [Mycolicibacterium rutilum]